MHVTAHRGFGEEHPQNTLAAFRAAASHADTVEVDVRRSGSGDLVASHFEHVRLVSDGRGTVSELSTAELADLSVEGSGEGVPTLREVYEVVPDDTAVNMDLKSPALADDALSIGAEFGNDVVVSSFYSDALWEARDVDDDVRLAYNFDVRLDRNLETTRLLDCEQANPHWTLALATDVVERAHDAGMDVHPWPVHWTPVARALDWKGVEGVIATRPGRV